MSHKTNKTGGHSVKVIEKKSKKRKSKKRNKSAQRPVVPPVITQTLMFFIKLFSFLTVSVITAWLGVEFTKEFQARQQEKVELKAKQINEIHELELTFKDDQISFAFYVEETNETGETSLNFIELNSEQLTFHERQEFPYPYLRVICENKTATCPLKEAKSLELYFNPSDFQAMDIR